MAASAAAALVVATLTVMPTAHAAGSCDELTSNLLGKFSASSTSVYGTRARIEYRKTRTCVAMTPPVSALALLGRR